MQSKVTNLSLQEMKQKLTDATGEERIDLLLAIVEKSSYSPLDEAEAYIDEAIKLSKQKPIDIEKLCDDLSMKIKSSNYSHDDKAKFTKALIKIAAKSNNVIKHIEGYLFRGEYLRQSGESLKARAVYRKAVEKSTIFVCT